MTGIPMALTALLATANAQANNPSTTLTPAKTDWQTVVLTEKSPQAAKRLALSSRGVESRPVPPAEPLVAQIQPDGTIVIGHRKPKAKPEDPE